MSFSTHLHGDQVDNLTLSQSRGYRDSCSDRMDFSGIFGSTSIKESGHTSGDSQVQQQRRRRSREPLQFETEIDDLEIGGDELSMEALHFFGLTENVSPTFDQMSADGSPMVAKRQRHFSLEDYNAMDDSEDSNLSLMSAASSVVTGSKRSRQGSFFYPSLNEAENSATAHFSASTSLSSSTSDFSAATSYIDNSNDIFAPSKFLSSPVMTSPFASGLMTSPSMSLELDNDHIGHQLRVELESRLVEAICPDSKSNSRFRLELPPQLLANIAAHIVQEAADEPYGLKGCLLHIYFDSDTDCEYVASLDCDPDIVSTFELKLTLRPDNSRRRSSWRNKLPDLVRNFSSFSSSSIPVGTSYKLIKRRNYSSSNQCEANKPVQLKL